MALERQTVSIPLVGALDTKTDEKLVEPGSLSAVADGIYTKRKTVNKRNGYTALSQSILSGGSVSTGFKLAKREDELLLLGDNKLYSYSETSSKWIDKGSITPAQSSSVLVSKTNEASINGSYSPDIGFNSNIKLIAWFQDGYDLYVSVVDQQTGTQYLSSKFIETTSPAVGHFSSVRVVSVGSYIYVLWTNNATIRYSGINISAPDTLLSIGTLIGSNVEDTYRANLDAITYGSDILVCYVDSSVPQIVIKKYNSSLVLQNTYTQAGTPYGLAIAYDSSNNNIYCAFNNISTTIKYFVIDSSFSSVLAVTTVSTVGGSSVYKDISCIVESANSLRIFWSQYNPYSSPIDGLSDYQVNTATGSVLGSVSVNIGLYRGLTISSKPFLYGSNTYIVARKNSFLQGTLYLLDKSGNLSAKALFQQALPVSNDQMSSVVQSSTGIFEISKEALVEILNTGLTFAIGNIADVSFNLSSPQSLDFVEVNSTTILSGAYPSVYDGATLTELGFNVFPENIVSAITAAGGVLDSGLYTYYVLYEWIDAKGNKYQSAPSTGTSVTITVNSSYVTLSIPTLRVTAKDPAYIVVYRTTKNGTVPYRLNFVTSGTSNPVDNSKQIDYITFQDLNPDTSITSNEILYTAGGVVENIPPPAFKSIELYKNRVIAASIEDGKSFWYSKQLLPKQGVDFSDLFYVTVDALGENITVVKSLDDKLIIFKENIIFAMAGDGPLDTGEQNNFTVPQIISTDVGCPYPDTVVMTPVGLMFQSYKGIYLLDRSLRVSYVGSPVEQYNSQTFVSATLLESVNQVRFLTSSGRTLIYDYFFDKWGTFTNHTGYDSVIHKGIYNYLRTNGVVYKESTSTFTDNGTAIVLNPVTPWIKFNSLEGFQRIRRAIVLGNYFSAHTLTVKVYYDYNNNVYDTYSFNTATGLVGSDNVYQFRIHLKRQKCESIKFEFDDSVAAIPGQGYSLNDVTVEVGIKRGLNKLPAIKSVG